MLIKLSKLFKIGLFANIIEWYEFLVYFHFSAIIGKLFFPADSETLELIQVFLVFAISYLARPFGALFFGYFSERYGQAASLKLSLMMMSLPTIGIGLLPSYATCGFVAPVSLLLLRLVQSFAAGGEGPIVTCYVFENAPQRYRTLLTAMNAHSSMAGSALGSSVASVLFLTFDEATILAGIWRIPFLLGIPLTAWIASIRKYITDSFYKTSPVQSHSFSNPFKRLFQEEGSALLKSLVLCAFSSTVGVYILSLWLPFYLTHFCGYPSTVAHLLNTVMNWLMIPLSLTAAWLSRYAGVPRLMQLGILLSIVLAVPVFKSLPGASIPWLYASVFILKLPLACVAGVIFYVLGALFKNSRALGMSIAFTFPTALIAGFSPALLTIALDKTGLLVLPAFAIIALGVLALPAAFKLQSLAGSRNLPV
jgi:MFS transporter, MHS family, proline/betaine transporter